MSLPEVATVEIDFQRKTATVKTKDAKALTRESVEQVLKARGYGVTEFTQKSGS